MCIRDRFPILTHALLLPDSVSPEGFSCIPTDRFRTCVDVIEHANISPRFLSPTWLSFHVSQIYKKGSPWSSMSFAFCFMCSEYALNLSSSGGRELPFMVESSAETSSLESSAESSFLCFSQASIVALAS